MADKIEEADVDEGTRRFAITLYERYVANADGKNYLGLACPSWNDLTAAVRSHWCAVAVHSRDMALDAWNERSRLPAAGLDTHHFMQWWVNRPC